jgi:NAD(P)H-dependent FMN reductase
MARPFLVISGTNRPGANALRVAKLVESHYLAIGAPVELYSLADLPRELFDPSSYATKPASFVPVQEKVVAAAGLHVITPEYNGSFPGVLKYFIDMLKFPESFEKKPVAFVGEAAGVWGGLRSVEQLQHIFGYRNAHVFPERVFIAQVHNKLDADGKLTDPMLAKLLDQQVSGFVRFAEKLHG